jgi:hypothetical protein
MTYCYWIRQGSPLFCIPRLARRIWRGNAVTLCLKNACARPYCVKNRLKRLIYFPVNSAFSPIFALSGHRSSIFQTELSTETSTSLQKKPAAGAGIPSSGHIRSGIDRDEQERQTGGALGDGASITCCARWVRRTSSGLTRRMAANPATPAP